MKKQPSSPLNASPAGAPTTEQQTALAVVGAGSFNLKPIIKDAAMGRQLTEQYQKAVGGMTEVLRFGGMMMQLREELSTRGKLSKGGPSKDGSGGITGWLEQFAPDIKRSTAERFLHVAEAVAHGFENTSGLTFVDLVTSPTELLPEPARLSQQELWDFVSGTSQRSWLDRFAPAEKKPALPLKPLPKRTEEEIEKIHREREIEIFDAVYRSFGKKTWHYLPDQLIKGSIDMFEEFIEEAKAHLAIPKRDRVVLKIKAALSDK